jgi:hypothetical protein
MSARPLLVLVSSRTRPSAPTIFHCLWHRRLRVGLDREPDVAGGALVLALKSKLVGSEPSQILSHGTGGSREPFPRTAPAGCELEIGDGGLLGAPGLFALSLLHLSVVQLPWTKMPHGLHSESSPPAVTACPSTPGLERPQEGGGVDHCDDHLPHRKPGAGQSHGRGSRRGRLAMLDRGHDRRQGPGASGGR